MAVVLVLGFSNIFADALSMGVGEYLSSKVRPYARRPLLYQVVCNFGTGVCEGVCLLRGAGGIHLVEMPQAGVRVLPRRTPENSILL